MSRKKQKLNLKKLGLPFPIHPFLFALYPILFFYSNNIREVFLDVLPLPLFVVVIFTLCIFLVFNLFFKDKIKSGIATSLFLVLFFSYGHMRNTTGGFNIGRFELLTPIWIGSFLLGTYLLTKIRKNLSSLCNYLNIISALLVGFSLVNIIYFEISTSRVARSLENRTEEAKTTSTKLNKPDDPPDIYYLIFDRYASVETLEDIYNYDSSEFTDYLTQKGFYVATNSRANYPRTFLSLGSSLNMEYINYLAKTIGEDSDDESAGYKLLNNFKAQKLLKEIGYQYIHIGSWWEPTRKNDNADRNYFYNPFKFKYLEGLDEFSTKLLETTILSVILYRTSPDGVSEPLWGRSNHRQSIIYQFEKLEDIISKTDGPKFVFAHILIPHLPYVLDQDCKTITEKQAKSRSNEANYLNQLGCANKKIKPVVEKIFEESAGSAIVILQSDEGPDPTKLKLEEKWQKSSINALKEKTGILNAYYLPGKDKKKLYPAITPVNSFRIIFNLYFGADFDILEDKIYMIENKEKPYKFFEFTEKLK